MNIGASRAAPSRFLLLPEIVMKHHLPAPEFAIFRRTATGQRAVLADILLLAPMQRRVLLVVNGITSLTDLAVATGTAVADLEKCASALLAQGLIEPA